MGGKYRPPAEEAGTLHSRLRQDPKRSRALSADGAVGAGTLEDLVDRLERPRTPG